MNDTKKISNKKILLIAIGISALLFFLMAIQLFRTNPSRTMNSFLAAIQNGNREAAMELVSDGIEPQERENITYFVDDWASADTLSIEQNNTVAWRQRVVTKKENGEEVAVKNQYNDRLKEVVPTTRYLAGMYEETVVVNYDDDEDPVVITVRRKGNNRWSRLGTAFRGWEIVKIQYQQDTVTNNENRSQGNSTQENTTEELYEFDGTENIDYTIDEKGNVVIVEPQPSADGEKKE